MFRLADGSYSIDADPECFMVIINFLQVWFYTGWFFNWPSPENVSRLAPPKFAWTGPPLNLVSVGIIFTSPDT